MKSVDEIADQYYKENHWKRFTIEDNGELEGALSIHETTYLEGALSRID
jgi:hypothetical protein